MCMIFIYTGIIAQPVIGYDEYIYISMDSFRWILRTHICVWLRRCESSSVSINQSDAFDYTGVGKICVCVGVIYWEQMSACLSIY